MDFKSSKNLRLQQIPVLYVRGTHHEVGFSIGRTFKSLFQEVIQSYDFLDSLLIPFYNTVEGGKLYGDVLKLCQSKFPGYVKELEGIALGCEIPFYKLFLLQIEMQIIIPPSKEENKFQADKSETGCTCILSYPDKGTVLLGHTEDARRALQNNIYILDAEILDKSGEKIEKFSTLCYSCCLPGYTMGYNEHGVFHSMNSLVPSEICPDKTPGSFIMRALLGAKSLDHAIKILRDPGTGTADGFSANLIYAPSKTGQIPILQNVEVAPNPGGTESRLDVLHVNFGQSYAHANKYLRLPVAQKDQLLTSSEKRLEAIGKYKGSHPLRVNDLKEIFSDRSCEEYPIFCGYSETDKGFGLASTVAVGIFDIMNRKWYLYTHPPNSSSPVAVLPITIMLGTQETEI